ncbi:hypothetical protein POTOM_017686 [Populus tomentosa]|uniref:phenylalanine--tRNA ligase n=1 Tax=Populus tomentosa TaxID=118781 RepID=A0A8X7ZV68_POPTO|nr:hypothetical protein POTOM_017686 [Populus tomentosa]
MAEEAILGYLENHEEIPDSGQFATDNGLDHNDVVNVIKSLHGFLYIEAQDIKRETLVLTEEGRKYAEKGSPEVQLFLAVPEEGSISKEELQKLLDPAVFKIGCSQAAKNKWVQMGNQISRKVQHVEDRVKDLLLRIQDGQEPGKDDNNSLKARKLTALQTWKGYSVKRGPDYAPTRRRTATDLTREHLLGYAPIFTWGFVVHNNFNTLGLFLATVHLGQPNCGIYVAIHTPKKSLLAIIFKLIDIDAIEFIFPYAHDVSFATVLQMFIQVLPFVFLSILVVFLCLTFVHWSSIGCSFEEMPTNKYVESSFWNFDALFQPQQHPARDSHDTFFLKAPETTKQLPEDYVELVKRVHESGGYGSRGYGYEWKREEANKNLLRTHTTAISSRMLYALAQSFTPKKYFSIDRVFRNEAVDRTHLAEFHQIEGLVCDRGLTLGHLIGVLQDFFSRLGMDKLKFKPAYNPYTEPSMEIFRYKIMNYSYRCTACKVIGNLIRSIYASYHEGLEKWVEIGNSGMFRPEMLRPMGFSEDVNVIAWGLSLERWILGSSRKTLYALLELGRLRNASALSSVPSSVFEKQIPMSLCLGKPD